MAPNKEFEPPKLKPVPVFPKVLVAVFVPKLPKRGADVVVAVLPKRLNPPEAGVAVFPNKLGAAAVVAVAPKLLPKRLGVDVAVLPNKLGVVVVEAPNKVGACVVVVAAPNSDGVVGVCVEKRLGVDVAPNSVGLLVAAAPNKFGAVEAGAPKVVEPPNPPKVVFAALFAGIPKEVPKAGAVVFAPKLAFAVGAAAPKVDEPKPKLVEGAVVAVDAAPNIGAPNPVGFAAAPNVFCVVFPKLNDILISLIQLSG